MEEMIETKELQPSPPASPLSAEEKPTADPIAEDSESTNEIHALKAEIDRLRASLAKKEETDQKLRGEMEDFNRLFPTTPIREVPESVWADVERGVPLSAAYALYEKRACMDRLYAEEINRQNSQRSAGRAGLYTKGEYFSPDEVRSMSASEVRANYKKIRESMKKWR